MSFWKSLVRPDRPLPDSAKESDIAPGNARQSLESSATESTSTTKVVNTVGSIMSLNLDLIDSNPYQPRLIFDNERLVELAASIAEFGVLQPIIVRRAEGRYQLIAGERRTRAARLAGLKVIPAIVRDASDDHSAMLSLIENLQREDLNIIEEIRGYARLLAEFDLTQEELARRLGRSQSGIANKLRLLRLPVIIQEDLAAAGLSERHARALLRLPTEEMQLFARDVILEQGFNVKQTEQWIEEQLQPHEEPEPAEEIPEEPVSEYPDQTPRRVRRFVPGSMLLFFNEFKRVVNTLNETGIGAEYHQEEDDEAYTITVRIEKKKP